MKGQVDCNVLLCMHIFNVYIVYHLEEMTVYGITVLLASNIKAGPKRAAAPAAAASSNQVFSKVSSLRMQYKSDG